MPVSDYEYMLRTGAADLDATEDSESGVKVGASPYQPIKARVYVPSVSGSDTPTLSIKFQESDDDSSYSDIEGGAMADITAAGTYEFVLPRWTKLYIRHHSTLSGTSPNFGKTTIGFTPGQVATT
jgi:hypothetical protein